MCKCAERTGLCRTGGGGDRALARLFVACLSLVSVLKASPTPFVSASSSVMRVLVLAPDHVMLCHLPIACSQGTRTSAHLVLRLLRATVESDMITALCPPGRGHVLLCFLSSSLKLSKMVQWYKGKHRLHEHVKGDGEGRGEEGEEAQQGRRGTVVPRVSLPAALVLDPRPTAPPCRESTPLRRAFSPEC